MEYDPAWKIRPLFDHLQKHFQVAIEPESHQVIDVQIQEHKPYETIHEEQTHQTVFQVLVSMWL